MLNFYDVPEVLHFDYFHRVAFLHSEILKEYRKQDKREQDRKKEQSSWTEEKLRSMGIAKNKK